MNRVEESTITFPYKRSLGPVIGAFLTGLADQRILGIRCGERVLCPPLEWDPATGAELVHDDLVEVGPAGTVESWSWVSAPSEQHPMEHPFAFALVRLDGADTTLVHVVDAGAIDAMSTGMRVAPRWSTNRTGHITDLEAFVPGEDPVVADSAGLDEPVTMMDYNASITTGHRSPRTRCGPSRPRPKDGSSACVAPSANGPTSAARVRARSTPSS